MPNIHLRKSSIANQNTGGGNKKAGLPPSVGLNSFAKRFIANRSSYRALTDEYYGITTSNVTNMSNEDEKEEKQINYMDILKLIIPLIDKETSFVEIVEMFVEMFELIENNEYVYNILIDQTKSLWGKSIDSRIIKNFINIYMKYIKDDKEINQIIRTVKELFMKRVSNNSQLSELIDIIPLTRL